MDLKSYFSSAQKSMGLPLLIGGALILVLTAGVLWWAFTPRQQLLFGNLREADAAEIVQSLDAWKVPHAIADGGTSITVPADLVYDTRMRLVSAGVPKGGHVGFELFDNSDFGVTEFAQRVNFQRALQGEIERTISSLPSVETARVHLTIRRPGLFVGEHESSKASVALTLRPGTTLSRQQVNGIRSLVAAAVEGLSPNAVSVLDSNGALLAAASPDGAEASVGADGHSDDASHVEDRIRTHVTQILSQVLHDQDFKVSVDATLNFDTVHEVSDRPLPQGDDGNGLVVRKRTNSSDAADGNGKKQSQEETEYVHGTEHEEISRAPGRLERLSVAVILPPNFDEFQMPQIEALVSAAAGIDPKRGDHLEVSRMGRAGTALAIAAEGAAVVPADPIATADQTRVYGDDKSFWRNVSWAKLLPVFAVLFLFGSILFIATRGRRRLSAAERDAVLGKLRGWLAEGASQP